MWPIYTSFCIMLTTNSSYDEEEGYNGFPARFSRGTTRPMSWPDGERYLHSLQSLVVSLFLSFESNLVFSRTGGVLSHRNSSTHSISTEELVLPRYPRCFLSRLRCNVHSLLSRSYLSRIGRIENSFCSACEHSFQDTSHLILHCAATDSLRHSLFGDSLSLYDLWFRPWGVSSASGAPWSSAMSPSLERGWATTRSKKFGKP